MDYNKSSIKDVGKVKGVNMNQLTKELNYEVFKFADLDIQKSTLTKEMPVRKLQELRDTELTVEFLLQDISEIVNDVDALNKCKELYTIYFSDLYEYIMLGMNTVADDIRMATLEDFIEKLLYDISDVTVTESDSLDTLRFLNSIYFKYPEIDSYKQDTFRGVPMSIWEHSNIHMLIDKWVDDFLPTSVLQVVYNDCLVGKSFPAQLMRAYEIKYGKLQMTDPLFVLTMTKGTESLNTWEDILKGVV